MPQNLHQLPPAGRVLVGWGLGCPEPSVPFFHALAAILEEPGDVVWNGVEIFPLKSWQGATWHSRGVAGCQPRVVPFH